MCTYTATRIRLAACGGAADGLYAVGASVKGMSSSEKKKPKKKTKLTQSHTSLPAPNGAELPSCLTYSTCLVHMPLNIRPYLSQFNRCVQLNVFCFFFAVAHILEVSFVVRSYGSSSLRLAPSWYSRKRVSLLLVLNAAGR